MGPDRVGHDTQDDRGKVEQPENDADGGGGLPDERGDAEAEQGDQGKVKDRAGRRAQRRPIRQRLKRKAARGGEAVAGQEDPPGQHRSADGDSPGGQHQAGDQDRLGGQDGVAGALRRAGQATVDEAYRLYRTEASGAASPTYPALARQHGERRGSCR